MGLGFREFSRGVYKWLIFTLLLYPSAVSGFIFFLFSSFFTFRKFLFSSQVHLMILSLYAKMGTLHLQLMNRESGNAAR